MTWVMQAVTRSTACVYAEESQEVYDKGDIIASGVCGKDEDGNDSVFYDVYKVYDEQAADEGYDPYDLIDDYKTIVIIHGTGPMYDYTKKTGLKSPFDKYNFENPVEVVIEDGVTRIGSKAFQDGWISGLAIAGSVRSIGSYAFGDCIFVGRVDLDSVNVTYEDDGVTSYEYDVLPFAVVIPEGVKTIEKYAFYYTSHLNAIELPDSLVTIGDHAFDDCREIKSINIPGNVKTIGNNAFESCDHLKSVTIPDSVTKIGECAFYNCFGIKSVTMGDGIKRIPEDAFCACRKLESVKLSKNLERIDRGAFDDCYKLRSINLPAKLKRLHMEAFFNCWKLKTITMNSKKPPKIVFVSNVDLEGVTLKCPKMSKAAKKKFRKLLKKHRMKCKVK